MLREYLTPYLRKVATLGRPIVLIDAFAGPGSFEDGKAGSPLILCHAAELAQAHGLAVRISVECIEADQMLHAQLVAKLAPFSFARAHCTRFIDFIPRIETLAHAHTLFL